MLLHSISTGITPLSQRQLAQNVCELPRSHDHHDDDDDDASPVVIAGPGKTQAFAVYIYICMYVQTSVAKMCWVSQVCRVDGQGRYMKVGDFIVVATLLSKERNHDIQPASHSSFLELRFSSIGFVVLHDVQYFFS